MTQERAIELMSRPRTGIEELEWNLSCYEEMIERSCKSLREDNDPLYMMLERSSAIAMVIDAARKAVAEAQNTSSARADVS